MQRVTVLCVGSLKEPFLRAALDEYRKRLSTLCTFQVLELPEAKTENNVETEGKRILSSLPDGCDVVALCVEGKELSSPELASYMEKSALGGKNGVCFIIGGSNGLSDEVKNRADLRLSFSKLTFPHQLFRVMLAEQIYRAYQIRGNTKYHK